VQEILTLIEVKTESEGIKLLYQLSSSLELLINRVIQVAIITMVNGSKSNPELMAMISDSHINERSVSTYFEFSPTAICELATLFNQALVRAKGLLASKNPFVVTKLSTEEKKIDPLLKEINQLKKIQDNYKVQVDNLMKENTELKGHEVKLIKELENLKEELKVQTNCLSNKITETKELDTELNNLQMQVKDKDDCIARANEVIKSKEAEIKHLSSLLIIKDKELESSMIEIKTKPILSLKSVAQITCKGNTSSKDIAKLDMEIRAFYEHTHKQEVEALKDNIKLLTRKVISLVID
jgi:chromosome segregation ATPase